jgi:hypothetical protein
MRAVLVVVGVAAVFAVGMWFGGIRRASDGVARETVPLPMLLKEVQALGELHTASYSYENVYTHRTHAEPQGLLAAMPGAGQIARLTTTNEALVSADGTVEAGVDLAKAQIESGRIVLPRARMYEPQVHARFHQVKRGLLWRDEDLAFGAIRDAKERMAGAAREGGILAEAEKNAVDQVRRLVGPDVRVAIGG